MPSANACSIATAPTGWSRRLWEQAPRVRRGTWPRRVRALPRLAGVDPAEGHGHQCVLRRQFRGTAGRRVAGVARSQARHLQAPGDRGGPGARRRAVRRHRGRAVVRGVDRRGPRHRRRCATNCCSARMRRQVDERRAVRTTCPYCGVGCGVLATPSDGRRGQVAGDPEHPANLGRCVPRAQRSARPSGLKGRLLQPRVHGSEVDWDRRSSTWPNGFRASSSSMARMRSPSTSRASC